MMIRPMDAVIVCARNEDDVSHLEVWIYEDSDEGDSNMYVHHDIIISAFPLCTAWLDCPVKGGEKGNFMAVGSMEPSIEIWDLDIIDEVQPCLVLGGAVERKTKKGKKKSKYKEGSHTGEVLGLALNKEYRNILASASADKQVKIWHVAAGKCNITMEHHEGKVQAVAWNHHVPQVLLSGSFDHSVVMVIKLFTCLKFVHAFCCPAEAIYVWFFSLNCFEGIETYFYHGYTLQKDGRVPSHSGFKWSVTAEVECLAWDPHTEYSFVVSLEDDTVRGYDIRAAKFDPSSESKPSFTLHAHDKAVCTLSYNPAAPNLLATGSMDKMGAVFSISFSQDSPFLLAIGGSKGKLEVWDTLSETAVSGKFGNYSQPNKPKT
ncbi:hypothetical protein CRYUN_Cryun22dG0054200 [Craigia yunnanensis]